VRIARNPSEVSIVCFGPWAEGKILNFLIRHPVMLLVIAGVATLSYMVLAKVNEEPSGGSGFRGGFGSPPVVGVSTVEMRVIADEIESVGTSVANESLDLSAKVSEIVFSVNFEDGDFVEKGKVLVELVNADEASRLAEAQANVDDALRQLERVGNLSARNLVASTELDTARTNVETAKARLEGVMVAMEDRLVRAPFSGYLGFRNISEGTLLTPSSVISTLDDISTIKLDFTIPEMYLANVKAGQTIQAQSVVYDDQIFEGTVSNVGTRINPVTRGVAVRATIDNAELQLRPGMLMTVSLSLNAENVLVVPERAVISAQGIQYAFTVDSENKVTRKEVALGRRRGGMVEIESGLAQGERIVSDGAFRVRPGITVQIEGEAPAAAPSGRPPSAGGTIGSGE
jgi:membrane fusion protein (multidrug efflux system)